MSDGCRQRATPAHRRAGLVAGVIGLLVGCGATIQAPKRTRMTAREIVDRSKPAIVRVEAHYGAGRVGVGTGFVVGRDGRLRAEGWRRRR